ncbi:hypothetical protein K2173_011445 [Erythroxylum novogranatense]|uniref:DUF4283 domain-containing protein n=1 Tax=Erythroxylum novogranatense TaxID=1862640 RepID=A0AAV8TG01_9ROSI|nr:hypothetical protein K2173_011445 [Erythroxylum novogranatense]
MDYELFLIKFQVDEDYLHVLTYGPWMIFGNVLAVQRWVPSFCPSQAKISHVVVWVRIPNLPIARYYPQILRTIGNLVGDTVRIDDASLHAQRGRYARLTVQVDLTTLLRSSMTLDGETHRSPRGRLPKGDRARRAVELRVAQTDGTNNDYGPWTNVQRRRQDPSSEGTTRSAPRFTWAFGEGSRFAALHAVEEGLAPGYPSETPAGQLEGLGQRVQVGNSSGLKAFQFKGALGRQPTQARKSTQASKGKSLLIPPLARK